MAITQSDFDALQRAIVGPEQTIEADGRRVTYRPVAELKAAADYATNALSAESGRYQTMQSVTAFVRD